MQDTKHIIKIWIDSIKKRSINTKKDNKILFKIKKSCTYDRQFTTTKIKKFNKNDIQKNGIIIKIYR